MKQACLAAAKLVESCQKKGSGRSLVATNTDRPSPGLPRGILGEWESGRCSALLRITATFAALWNDKAQGYCDSPSKSMCKMWFDCPDRLGSARKHEQD